MSNPILNDKSFDKAARAGWAAPDPATRAGVPYTDGPISTWHSGTMTVNGTITATGVLFVLLLAAGVVGWLAVPEPTGEVVEFPTWTLAGIFVGLACAIGLMFRPMWARILGPVYAIAEGVFIGAISHAYELAYDGIVVQAAGATAAVFAVMLVLYRTQIIKVTDRFRRIVVGATLGVMVFYGLALLARLFGADVGFLRSPSALGIGFSLLVAGLAAMNLALDFDFIEKGARQRLPEGMEWFAAFGLMVTIVWLYLELLRLLAKLRER